jgi:hypothetical protein
MDAPAGFLRRLTPPAERVFFAFFSTIAVSRKSYSECFVILCDGHFPDKCFLRRNLSLSAVPFGDNDTLEDFAS